MDIEKSNQKIIEEVEDHLSILRYSRSTAAETYSQLKEFNSFLQSKYGKISFAKVSKEMVSEYQNYIKTRANKNTKGKLSASQINSHIHSIKRLSEYLWKESKISFPVAHLQRLKEEAVEKETLTVEEIKQLYSATHPTNREGFRDRAMLSVYYGCGLRRMEGESLKLRDVDFTSGFIHVRNGKGRKERLVPMSKSVQLNLKEYISSGRPLYVKKSKREERLFIGIGGRSVSCQTMMNRLKLLLKTTNITKKIGIHSLRHSIATHLLDRGMELEDISRFLGHSSLESTQIYTHINEQNV